MVNMSGRRWQFWMTVAIALLLIGLNSCAQVSLPVQAQEFRRSRLLTFVPKQSVFATVLDISIRSDKYWRHSSLSNALIQATSLVFSSLSVDLNEDIRPWLGDEIAFAITDKDLDRDRSNGRQAGYLLVADTADGNGLREFLELFWQQQSVSGTQPVLTKISGVPIISGWVGEGSRQLATAVVDDSALLVANDLTVLRQSLRVAQVPDLQLADHDCCAAVWTSLQIPEFLDWLGVATHKKLPLPSAFQWQKLTASTELHPQRLTIDTTITGFNSQFALSESKKSFATLHADGPDRYMPESVAWAAMGNDLQPLWIELQNELDNYQGLPSLLQQGQQQLLTHLAQSLSDPIKQLLSNDYALGQLNDGTGLMAIRSTSSRVIEKLDSIARQQGLTVNQLMLKGKPVTVWSRLKTRVDTRNRETTVETDLVGVHTKVDDCHIFATSISGLTTALDAPEHKLSNSQRFRSTLQSMDVPNQGYIYGTWSELERLLASNRWFSLVKPILQPWSQSIDSIAVTSYGQKDHQSTGIVSILLKN